MIQQTKDENYYYQKIFSEDETAQIAKGILKGLVEIHKKDYIHRDLKPENVLLTCNDQIRSENVKIVDFGLSAKYKMNPNLQIDDKIGTILYMAPEQISYKKYGKKIDIFALGVIIFELATGKHPLYISGKDTLHSFKEKLTTINSNKWHFPEFLSQLFIDLICKLCSKSQVQRYDAKTALSHPWITRNFSDKIPDTRQQQISEMQNELALSKIVKLMMFISLVKKFNDKNSAPPCKAQSMFYRSDTFDFIDKSYREKIELANQGIYDQEIIKLNTIQQEDIGIRIRNIKRDTPSIRRQQVRREFTEVNSQEITMIDSKYSKSPSLPKKSKFLLKTSNIKSYNKQNQLSELLFNQRVPNYKYLDYQSNQPSPSTTKRDLTESKYSTMRTNNKTISPTQVHRRKVLKMNHIQQQNDKFNFKLQRCSNPVQENEQKINSPNKVRQTMRSEPKYNKKQTTDEISKTNRLPEISPVKRKVFHSKNRLSQQIQQPEIPMVLGVNCYTQSNDIIAKLLQ